MQHKTNVFALKFNFIGPKISVSIKLRLFLIYNDETFPMQSSEFIKSLYFGSNLKKTATKFKKILVSPKKWIFFYKNIYSEIEKPLILIDLNEIFPMTSSELDDSHSVESPTIPHVNRTMLRLESRLCQNVTSVSIIRQRASRSGQVRPGQLWK